MHELLHDIRYGLRMLLKTPGATVVGLLALALGIGANTAIFTVTNAVLIRPLPYPDSTRIVAVFETKLDKGMHGQFVSPLDYKNYRESNQVFDRIGAIRDEAFVLTGRDLPERIEGASVSPEIFAILEMRPVLGRPFTSEEDRPDKNSRVIVSYGLWRRRFSEDSTILGSSLTLNGRSYLVVGVAPPGFHLVDSASELWIPYTPDPKELTPEQQGVHTLRLLAHLKPGISRRQAELDMQAIAARMAEANPNINSGYSAELIPLRDQVIGNIGGTIWILTGAVTFVLLIACANVANLLLARAGAREKEIAVRNSLGASAGRIVRQMLTESVLLAVFGGFLGLALAYWATQAIVKFAPRNIPRLDEISVDWRVLAFTLLVAVATGIVFGLAPSLASIRPDLNSILRGSGRGNTASLGRRRMRDVFVISEIACCVVLLTGAGLLIRSFVRLQQVDPGFRTEDVLTMQLTLPPAQYSGMRIARFYENLLERVQRIPGVRSAGMCRFLPLTANDISLNFQIEGRPRLALADQPRAQFRAASSGYFEALGIPLIRGRVFTVSDGERTPKVAVINEVAARRYWPGEDPVGKRILSGADDDAWSTIIGVVGNVKHAGLDADTKPETYYHYLQIPADVLSVAESTMFLAVRTRIDPSAMTSSVRQELRSLDPNQPVFNVRTMAEVMGASVSQVRFRMLLLAVFAGLALLLAAIGLYGVMAYSVTQRTNELGVRMALGANANDIVRLIVGQGLRMTAIGVAIGVTLAGASTWVLSRLLFGIHAIDPVSFLAACLVTITVALVASGVPAWRAIRVAPATALRAE